MAFPKPFFRWRPHPWHGLEVGPDPPHVVQAYIEITPYDTDVRIDEAYGREHALTVIEAAVQDYDDAFGA